jgi:uncharacterized protein with GYD domain
VQTFRKFRIEPVRAAKESDGSGVVYYGMYLGDVEVVANVEVDEGSFILMEYLQCVIHFLQRGLSM